MAKNNIYSMAFSALYPLYINKATRKGRTKQEVDTIIKWLTGYDEADLILLLDDQTDIETFFKNAPHLNPARNLIKGTICGVRIEEITDPLMQEIRYLDKLIDELSKGKPLDKILRNQE